MLDSVFLDAQDYGVKDSIVYQDNKSSILLEKNGKASSSKRTKHINIRYFFITDRISQGEMSVEWCPTGDMIADFATKPLQGAMFKKFWDLIMGVVPVEDSRAVKQDAKDIIKKDEPRKSKKSLIPCKTGPQECVGENQKHARGTRALAPNARAKPA